MIFRKQKCLLLAILFVFALLAKGTNAVAKNLGKPRIILFVTKDTLNYEADITVPLFSEMLKRKYGYDVAVLLGSGGHSSYHYPKIEIISKADLLIIFARRIALPYEQMNVIKSYSIKETR